MTYLTPEELQKLQELERVKEVILHKILTKEAKERLKRIKLVKPELANQLELYLVQLYNAGQIRSVITDDQMKRILESLSSKKSFRIIR